MLIFIRAYIKAYSHVHILSTHKMMKSYNANATTTTWSKARDLDILLKGFHAAGIQRPLKFRTVK